MKNKVLLLILIIGCLFFTGCVKKTDENRFKNEYESLNGESNPNGQAYREIEIDDDVKVIYKTEDEIVKAIEDDETFIVYFGFATCPWCRSVLPTFFEVAEEDVQQIYYVNVQSIRDTLKVNEKGKIETVNEGTEGYYKLLNLFDDVLSDYTLTDEEGNSVNTKEKRIYAPNMISVVNGEVKMMVSGISEHQSDPYEKLTEEMLEDTEKQFTKLIETITESGICTKDGC